MRRNLIIMIITAFVLLTAIGYAQDERVMTYQGYMTDTAGDPIEGGPHEIEVGYFTVPIGGDPFFTDSYFNIFFNTGQFTLGLEPPIEAITWPLWVELIVNGETMEPRQQITEAAFSTVTRRVNGDILTAPGVIELVPPEPVDPAPAVGIYADSIHSIKLNWPDSPGETSPAIQLGASEENVGMILQGPPGSPMSGGIVTMTIDGEEAMVTVQNIPEGQTTGPKVVLRTGAETADLVLDYLPAAGETGASAMLRTGAEVADLVLDYMPSPDQTSAGVELSDGPLGSNFRMSGPTPGVDPEPFIEMQATSDGGGMNFYHDGGKYMGVDPQPFAEGGALRMFYPQSAPPGVDPDPFIEMQTTSDGGGMNFYHDGGKYMGIDPEPFAEGGALRMFNPQSGPPEEDPEPLIEMQASYEGGSMVMFNPQPEPPGSEPDPFLEMQTDENGGAMNFYHDGGKYMGVDPNPFMDGGALNMYRTVEGGRPEYLAVAIEAGESGGSLDIYDDGGKYMGIDPTPFVDGGALKMFDNGGGATVEIKTDENGGGANFYEDGGKYMGIDPQPFSPGGCMRMFAASGAMTVQINSDDGSMKFYNDGGNYMGVDPVPFAPGGTLKMLSTDGGTTVEINSDGEVIANNGKFGQNNMDGGTATFMAGADNYMDANYSQLFGLEADLSQDSTFNVNMPHIRFGDDTDGYEFPTRDGTADQILMTDGSGQLHWEDMYFVASEGNKQLLEIVERLTAKVDQLETKIDELEQNISK
ncbi:MAG: hypothetical protein GY839_11845 [candidate division Zixibacteria bacterium]|nr:hypothetical protein [candidate division Zixibacteria bacterium]